MTNPENSMAPMPSEITKSTVNLSTSTTKHLVAIDLGSNSFHLLIARELDGCLQIMHRQKQAIGLAAGLDHNHYLSDAIIAKAINCLREFNLSLANLPSSAVRIVATQALRSAKNITHFKQQASKVLPYPIDVISGKMEAELIYKGVAHTQPLRGNTFIIDIGGGSTELAIGNNFTTSLTDSLAVGCVSFQQKFFRNGEISAASMREAQSQVKEHLIGIADRYRESKNKAILGTSGSIKVISQVMVELYGESKITAKRLKRLVEQLVRWQHCDNIPLRSLEDNRRPLLAAAVAILSSCFSLLGIEQMKFSLGGLREGVLYDLSHSRTDIDTRERTIQNLMKLYHVDQAFTQRVLQQLTLISQQFIDSQIQLNRAELTLLGWSVQLHEIGIAINSKKHQQHSAYIIEHSDMLGFSQHEQQTIAWLVRNHRGKIHQMSNETQSNASKPRHYFLMQLLRLTVILTQGRIQPKATNVQIKYQDNAFIIEGIAPSELRNKLNKEVIKQAKVGLILTIV